MSSWAVIVLVHPMPGIPARVHARYASVSLAERAARYDPKVKKAADFAIVGPESAFAAFTVAELRAIATPYWSSSVVPMPHGRGPLIDLIKTKLANHEPLVTEVYRPDGTLATEDVDHNTGDTTMSSKKKATKKSAPAANGHDRTKSSVRAFMYQAVVDGMDPAKILAAAQKAFPNRKLGNGDVNGQARKAKDDGHRIDLSKFPGARTGEKKAKTKAPAAKKTAVKVAKKAAPKKAASKKTAKKATSKKSLAKIAAEMEDGAPAPTVPVSG